jgi:hypothetical protein
MPYKGLSTYILILGQLQVEGGSTWILNGEYTSITATATLVLQQTLR